MSRLIKPLVNDNGQLEQLQTGQELDIPLAERVERLERQLEALVALLDSEIGIGATEITENA